MSLRAISLFVVSAVVMLAGRADAGADSSPAAAHTEAILVDGHNDVATWILDFGFDLGMVGGDLGKRPAELYWILGWLLPEPSGHEIRTHTDLARMRKGGVDAQFFSIFAHPRYANDSGGARGRAHAMIDAVEAQVERHREDPELADRAADIRRIASEGRIAVLLGLEGGHAIENDLQNLREFRERGVRYMTLTWSNTNAWAASSSDEPRHGGMTAFGRLVVCEMNRLGMIVDVSHASDETFWDALEVTQAPVMASHSSVRALVDNPRNLSDEMLHAIADNAGIVMINFGGSFVDPRKANRWRAAGDIVTHLGPSPVPLDLLLDHIDYAVAVAGVDHVGLGSDFDGTLFLPEGASDVSDFPNITAGLLARGYSTTDIRKILGENILRVIDQAEATSQSLARRPTSRCSGPTTARFN